MRTWWTIWAGCTAPSEPSAAPRDPEPAAPAPEPEPGVEGLELLSRLAGLWTGPATQTPLGDLPLMNVDLRPADAHALWGRVDVDPENALRFAFAIEDHGGPVLIYRNGGWFLGLYRDDRTALVETGEDWYRFCHLELGCDYIDATWTFEDPDRLVFDVQVRGSSHVYWAARRAEARPVDEGFPAPDPLPADAPMPTLPTAEVTVDWSTPLLESGHVWVLLSTSPCTGLDCVPSRQSRAVAPAGATSAVIRMPEIHSGEYRVTAVLDRDRDFVTVPLPEAGDGASIPGKRITVAPTGTTASSIRIALGG